MKGFIKLVRWFGLVAGVGALGIMGSACVMEPVSEENSDPVDDIEQVGDAEQAACLASYDAVIVAARNWVAQNCGGISGCGTSDNSGHSDVFLTNRDYCSCYASMWNNRGSYPLNSVQVIYHEPVACSSPHIHLRNITTTGILHFDLDEGSNDCTDNEPNSSIDEFFGSAGSRKGTCNN